MTHGRIGQVFSHRSQFKAQIECRGSARHWRVNQLLRHEYTDFDWMDPETAMRELMRDPLAEARPRCTLPAGPPARRRSEAARAQARRSLRAAVRPARRLLDDRYELGALRGYGGMASVYAGVDRRIDRPVAIKIFHRKVAESGFINDIIRGNRLAASLSHPFIASVFDFGVEDERPYVVMELVEGQSLTALTCLHGPREQLPWSRIVQIALKICAGLAYLQQRNLLHGDLKPSNIVLTCPRSLKLIDLDLCLLGGRDPNMRRVGTCPWLSPEQVDHGMRDIVSEIFTVGVMLYQLTTGELPFCGTEDEIKHKVSHLEFVPPREVVRSMPAAVDEVIRTAMLRRYQRYASVEALTGALEASLTRPEVAAWEHRTDVRRRRVRASIPTMLTLNRLTTTWLGQGHSRRTALDCLQKLLCSLFDRDEFRRFLMLGFAGDRLLDQLHEGRSHHGFVLGAIDSLTRLGLLDAAFFARLCEQRPQRRGEIQDLAEALNIDEEPNPPEE